MAIRNLRSRRPVLESLERRDTPSAALAGGHGIHELARHTITVRGTGTAALTSFTTLTNGATSTTANLTGQASVIGQFTGTLNATISPNHRHASGSAVLTSAGGSQLDLSLSGPGRVSRAEVVTGNLGFTITGGTGQFAHVTGRGTLNGTFNVQAASGVFSFSGKITA